MRYFYFPLSDSFGWEEPSLVAEELGAVDCTGMDDDEFEVFEKSVRKGASKSMPALSFMPGPWCKKLEVDEEGDPVQWIIFREGETRDIHIADLCVGVEPIGDAQDATASLIAAAPDLYEALQELLDSVDGIPDAYKAPQHKARAALRKAEGK